MKYNLYIFLLTFCTLIVADQDALGLVHRVREVTVSTGKKQQQVSLIIPITNNLTEYEEALTEIEKTFTKIEQIPALANDTKQYKSFESLFSSIKHLLPMIKTSLKIITDHRDFGTIYESKTSCNIRWKNFRPIMLTELSKKITTVTTNLKWDATATEYVATPAEFYKAHTAIANVQEFISDFSIQILDRVQLLESLLNKNINEEIMAALGSQGCIENAQFEKSKILACEKHSAGVNCLAEVDSLNVQSKYELYMPISYKGIQLTTYSPEHFLVKNSLEKWFLLECEMDNDEQLDIFDFCQSQEYNNKCSKALGTTDFTEYYSNCNFTKIQPTSYMDTTNGYLIMAEFEKIKLKSPNNEEKDVIISNEPPLLIQTSKIIELTENGARISIHPKSENLEEKLITTWLTNENIKSLQNKMLVEEILEEIDYGAYIDIALIIIVSIIIPVIAFLVKTYSKYKLPNDLSEKTRVQRGKHNLKQNKNVLRILK